MSQPRILVIGEALVDIVPAAGGEHIEHVGGSPANVAVGLARLGEDVRFATAIGADARGERVSEHLSRRGVRLTKGSITTHPTSTALVRFDADHNASYEFDLHWGLAPVKVGKRIGHIHTGSLATVLEPGCVPCLEAVTTHREQATLSYDPNIRPGVMGDLATIRARVEDLVPLIDVVKASADDVSLLYPGRAAEDVIDHWLSLGPALVVLTQGEAGVAYRTRTGELTAAPSQATHVVDTVGAGDSFMAGLICGLVGLDLLGGPAAREALRSASSAAVRPAIDRGLASSAITVGKAGAYAPSLDEL